MITAVLVGNIWATRKADSLGGYKMMLAKVLGSSKKHDEIMVVVDTIGAGIGDRVIITTGSSARKMLGNDNLPIDASVVGIVDEDCHLNLD